VTRFTEGFNRFVTSTIAPVASGWSGCRVGLAPTGKRHLFTAHTHYRHAVQHHGIYYKDFSHEPDPIGRYISIYPDFVFTAIAAVPFVAILFQLSQILAAVFSAVLVSHHLIWMLAHKEMHIPSNMFFRNWLPYKWLARNHWMHHKYRNVNYNLVFPLADLLFGTYKSPNPRDREQMSKSGL
jgi:hypothetical protein